jgi:inorganic phosphate transporter, PiT family
MTILFLLLCVMMLAYANGSNDNIKAVATLYGSRTLNYRQSLTLATVAQLAGSMASVVLAGHVVKVFSGKGLVPASVTADPTFLTAVAFGAAVTVLLATRAGMPISTTHALIGGLTGAGMALASSGFEWSLLGARYFVPLLISPVLAVVGAGLLYPLASRVRCRLGLEPDTCLCVEERADVPVGVSAMTVAPAGGSLQVAVGSSDACRTGYGGTIVGVRADTTVGAIHCLSGGALGFARGLNDTPKVMALLMAASFSGVSLRVSLSIVAIVMAVGGVLHSSRIARTMGERITEMNTGQGLLANMVAAGLVIGASMLGMGVSTTHVSNGAIFGIAAWTGKTDWRVVREIVGAWVITLPVAAAIAYVGALVLSGAVS